MTAGELATLIALAAGTLVSEDAAGLTAGVLASEGTVGLVPAIVAIGFGIWLGDLGLWAAGRFGTWRGLPRKLGLDVSSATVVRTFSAVLASRFLPGTRLALYVAAGAGGLGFGRFAVWSAVAVGLWTPVLVGAATLFGEAAKGLFHTYFSLGWVLFPATVILVWCRPAIAVRLSRLRRLARWEFWPAWLFYAPVVPWVLYLLFTRGARALLAANPGLEDAGFAGESKSRILEALPEAWTLPHVRIPPGDATERAAALEAHLRHAGWSFPIILKPDVGQRGDGVSLVSNLAEAHQYFAGQPASVIAQVYHPGPYEAGVFYYRMPGESRGHIFSVTDKHFPHVVGDGRTSLDDLIRGHERFRLQSEMFLRRHRDRLTWVPRAGERFRLGVAGNHAQGAIFLDGADLITDALTARIDEIAQSIEGFFIGRFDVRYRDPRDFMAGRDLAIVELNGVSSEATHIYDPSRSVWSAYRTLYQQWSLVFAIGAENLRRGRQAPGLRRLVQLSAAHVWPTNEAA